MLSNPFMTSNATKPLLYLAVRCPCLRLKKAKKSPEKSGAVFESCLKSKTNPIGLNDGRPS
jgi:hypothetical protein